MYQLRKRSQMSEVEIVEMEDSSSSGDSGVLGIEPQATSHEMEDNCSSESSEVLVMGPQVTNYEMEDDCSSESSGVLVMGPQATSYVNKSFEGDYTAARFIVKKYQGSEQETQLVDSSMQTSGEWCNILHTFQPLSWHKHEQPSSPQVITAETVCPPEEIEMRVFNSTRLRSHSYFNNGYEMDELSVDSPLVSGEPNATLDLAPSEDDLACNYGSSPNDSQQGGKTVKFSGCQIINRVDRLPEVSTPVSVMNIFNASFQTTQRRLQAYQLSSPQAKWHRLRCIHHEQEVNNWQTRSEGSFFRDIRMKHVLIANKFELYFHE